VSVSFDITAANSYLSFTAGTASAVTQGAYTVAVLAQPAVGNNNGGFAGAFVSSTQVRALFEDTNKIYGNNDFSSGFSTLTQGTWYLIAQSKAAGSNTYRHHVWAYAADGSGTMSHGVSTGSGNQGDNASAATELRIGFNVIKGNGPIAIMCWWTRVLSDAELDSMKSNLLTTWRDVSGGAPKELIHGKDFDGTNGSTMTVAIGTSSFSSKTGTTAAGANPPSFDFSLGGTNATATPSVVAAVAAVPSITIRADQTATASTVAASAAVPTATPRMSVAITPSTVAAVAAVGAPALNTGQTVTASTVAAVAAIPAPTVRLSAAITPSTVTAVTAVPSPTLQAGAGPAPATVAATATVGSPVVSGGALVQASVVAAIAAVGVPAVSAGGSATVSAATVAVAAAVGSPVLSTGSRPVPATVAAVASVPAPAVRLGVLALPATVAAIASVGTAVVTATGGATVSAVTVAVRTAVGTVIVTADTEGAPRAALVNVRPGPIVHVTRSVVVDHVTDRPVVHVRRAPVPSG